MEQHNKKPVALFVYNRPPVTAQTLNAIIQYRPETLFVVSDGPKNSIDDEYKVNAVRELLASCEDLFNVVSLHREENVGCRQSMMTGLDWVFDQVDQCIILEDDCLPDRTFFDYCAQLLDRYQNCAEVMSIGGFRAEQLKFSGEYSYGFSKYPYTWGWATWRRAVTGFRTALAHWSDEDATKWLESYLGSGTYARYWAYKLSSAHRGADLWDYTWAYHCWRRGGLSVYPSVSMIKNIGFGPEGTSTVHAQHPFARQNSQRLVFPMKHPAAIAASRDYDDRVEHLLYSGMQRRCVELMRKVALQRLPRGT